MKQDKRTVFVLAAGLGTRLKELTKDKPKALVSINNVPILKVILESLIRNDFNYIVVNIHHFGEQIIDFFEKNKFPDVEIQLSDERGQLMDTGGAVLQALPYFAQSEAVFVHNVDILTDVNLKFYYDEFCKSDDAAWLLTQNRDSKRKLVFDNHGNFKGKYNIETKSFDGKINLTSDCKMLSFSGLHIFKPKYFLEFEKKPCYIFDLYEKIAENHRVTSKFIETGYWFDLGTKEQLKNAELWLSLRR